MSSPLVSIIIVGYNSVRFLPRHFESIKNQTHKNLEIIFIDNGSTDGSCQYASAHFSGVTVVDNGQNRGLDYAWNQGIKLSSGKYVMLLNPDIVFEKDYLEKCVAKMESDLKIGVIGGKILKYDFEADHKTDIIDSVGLYCYRNRRIVDQGQGITDQGQFDHSREVFGITGACPLFRRSALDDCRIFGEYVDEDFFMYKEDIDLCWRLRLFGWSCFYLHNAIAYHGRGTGVLKRFSHLEVMRNRRHLSHFQKGHSYRNQRWMQLKNEFFISFLKDFFPIVWKEILISAYMVFREPYLIKCLFQTVWGIPRMLKKRREIFRRKKVSRREMEKWLRGKTNQET